MKLSMKSLEHLRISHDSGLGFLVYVEDGILHVRAKEPTDAECDKTTLVLGGAEVRVSR